MPIVFNIIYSIFTGCTPVMPMSLGAMGDSIVTYGCF